MGYRSAVAIRLYGKEEEMVALVASEKIKGRPNNLTSHPLDPTIDDWAYDGYRSFTYDEDGDPFMMIAYNLSQVKWYPSYGETQYWEALAEIVAGLKNSVSCEFVRIGEEAEDIEIVQRGDQCRAYLYPSSEIVDDGPKEAS